MMLEDCILRFETRVVKEGWLDKSTLEEIKQESLHLVEEAVSFAEKSSFPQLEECSEHVYVSY